MDVCVYCIVSSFRVDATCTFCVSGMLLISLSMVTPRCAFERAPTSRPQFRLSLRLCVTPKRRTRTAKPTCCTLLNRSIYRGRLGFAFSGSRSPSSTTTRGVAECFLLEYTEYVFHHDRHNLWINGTILSYWARTAWSCFSLGLKN